MYCFRAYVNAKPLARAVAAARCTPKALADDIAVFAVGHGHDVCLEKGYHIALPYLHAIGAKIAFLKCYLLTTCGPTRASLAAHVWPVNNTCVQVVLHFRDLNAHISTGARLFGCTLNNRIATDTPLPTDSAISAGSMQTTRLLLERSSSPPHFERANHDK